MSDRLAAMLPGWGIDIKGAGPLYHRLRLVLEKAILSGKLKEGDVLYSERDLAEHLRVSRVTVRKAIDHLVQDGFLVRRRGSGTFVGGSAVHADQPPLCANSLTGNISWRGSDTKVECIERSTSHPAPEEMMTLGLSSDSHVVRITCLRSSVGQPLAIERTCISSLIVSASHFSKYRSMRKARTVLARAGSFKLLMSLPSLRHSSFRTKRRTFLKIRIKLNNILTPICLAFWKRATDRN
ncbi:GntR family transcriptional regulator [Rhizobium leguminosarum]|uniref:GntR family transcriptional regulator n=1 Tax=Rhizobium leguminosarum TaxID=384 RepID=UPI001FEFC0DB|nr:GntR family transcriptional regulator [Rhizobium leguminosarum]